MLFHLNKRPARALLAGLSAAGVLVLVGISLVPPGTLPYAPTATYSDAAIAHWPAAYLLRESVWTQGDWPLWSPARMLGQPFAANPLNKVGYPPQWLALIFPPTIHLNVMIWLHLAWLGLGMMAWSRQQRLHPAAGMLAALGWGLSPKLVGHLGAGHLDIVYALAWTPWVLWSLGRLMDSPGWRTAVQTGIIAGLLLLADVRIGFYMLPFAGVVTIFSSLPVLWRTAFGWLIVAAMVCVLISAVEIVPLLAYSAYLTRAELSIKDAAEYSLPVKYLIGILIPDRGGLHEWMTYLGLPILLLALSALFVVPNRLRVMAISLLVLLAGWWALGENSTLFPAVASRLPLVSWLRVPSRAWFVVGLACVILAAWALDALMRRKPGKGFNLAGAGSSFAGAIWVLAAWLMLPTAPGALIGAGAALGATGAGMLILSRWRRVGAVWLISVTFLSLVWVDFSLIDSRSIESVRAAEQPILDQLDAGCKRVYSPSFDLIGPASYEAGLIMLHGADPFQLRWSAEAITKAAGSQKSGYSIILPPIPAGKNDLSGITPDIDRLRTLGVCALVTRYELHQSGIVKTGEQGTVKLYRVEQKGGVGDQVSLSGDNVRGWRAQSERVCVSAQSVLSVQQAWMPGWQAWVDGVRVEVQQAGALWQFELPAGCHQVAMAYRPMIEVASAAVSGLTGLILGASLLIQRKRVSA
jgi:hypothetical protein